MLLGVTKMLRIIYNGSVCCSNPLGANTDSQPRKKPSTTYMLLPWTGDRKISATFQLASSHHTLTPRNLPTFLRIDSAESSWVASYKYYNHIRLYPYWWTS